MAKLRSGSSNNGRKRNGGIVNLVEKLQKSFSIGRSNNNNNNSNNYNNNYNVDEFEDVSESSYVPEDVKEGHFAVVAVAGEEPRRFVVPLCYLAHPRFKRLLEQAAEEYGFDQEGALTIPCRACEIEKILGDRKWVQGGGGREVESWGSSNSMLQMC